MNKAAPVILHPVVTSLLFAASMVLASYFLGDHQLHGGVRLALVLLPILGFVLCVASWVDNYRRSDELHQRILLEALVTALIVSVLGALGLHYIRKAGFLVAANYPHLDYFGDVLPYAFVIGLLFGWWRARRRYQ